MAGRALLRLVLGSTKKGRHEDNEGGRPSGGAWARPGATGRGRLMRLSQHDSDRERYPRPATLRLPAVGNELPVHVWTCDRLVGDRRDTGSAAGVRQREGVGWAGLVIAADPARGDATEASVRPSWVPADAVQPVKPGSDVFDDEGCAVISENLRPRYGRDSDAREYGEGLPRAVVIDRDAVIEAPDLRRADYPGMEFIQLNSSVEKIPRERIRGASGRESMDLTGVRDSAYGTKGFVWLSYYVCRSRESARPDSDGGSSTCFNGAADCSWRSAKRSNSWLVVVRCDGRDRGVGS